MRTAAIDTAPNAATGVLLALVAYACYSWCDAIVKSLGGTIGVFGIAFSINVASIPFVLLARPREERWRDFLSARNPWAVHARATAGAFIGIFSIYAFTSIPFAEAYALIFLAPAFIALLSVAFLKEKVPASRWAALAVGFAGVMLVVRPGFKTLEYGHLAAAVAAFMVATVIVLTRFLSASEKQVTVLGCGMLHALVIMGAAMLATSTEIPSAKAVGPLFLAGSLLAAGQVLLYAAARTVPASRMAATQYSQIGWAVILGALFFDEYPDAIAGVGLAIALAAGLSSLKSSENR